MLYRSMTVGVVKCCRRRVGTTSITDLSSRFVQNTGSLIPAGCWSQGFFLPFASYIMMVKSRCSWEWNDTLTRIHHTHKTKKNYCSTGRTNSTVFTRCHVPLTTKYSTSIIWGIRVDAPRQIIVHEGADVFHVCRRHDPTVRKHACVTFRSTIAWWRVLLESAKKDLSSRVAAIAVVRGDCPKTTLVPCDPSKPAAVRRRDHMTTAVSPHGLVF